MARVTWDAIGTRFYETGVDRGVLYIPNSSGAYTNGVAWSGLTGVTESPSGAEANPQYADNIKYLNLFSAEEFGATIEAFTYPDEFNQFDGILAPTPGVLIGQQPRKMFGLSYRTILGNDVDGNDHGYKLHCIYGCKASPSERAYTTVNDSPEAMTFSWEVSTTPLNVNSSIGPTSIITIDSTKVDATQLAALEDLLYGTAGVDPQLPTPSTIITMFSSAVTVVTPTEPTFASNTITIPSVTGVTYYINDEPVAAGAVPITVNTIVVARPNAGYVFPDGVDDDWLYVHA